MRTCTRWSHHHHGSAHIGLIMRLVRGENRAGPKTRTSSTYVLGARCRDHFGSSVSDAPRSQGPYDQIRQRWSYDGLAVFGAAGHFGTGGALTTLTGSALRRDAPCLAAALLPKSQGGALLAAAIPAAAPFRRSSAPRFPTIRCEHVAIECVGRQMSSVAF